MENPEKDHIKKQLFWKVFLPVILAIPAAVIIKIFFLTSYHVPTASMSSTIIPGDHILVEKYILGTRFFFRNRTYRTPGIRSVRKGDLLVFNVPKEDSTTQDVRYYTAPPGKADAFHKDISEEKPEFTPIPFRTPFVKRAVGLPGDTVARHHQELWINQEPVRFSGEIHQEIIIRFDTPKSFDTWKNKLYREGERVQMDHAGRTVNGIFREKNLKGIDTTNAEIIFKTNLPPKEQVSPKDSWARSLIMDPDPLIIPFQGWTVPVTSRFLKIYGSLIRRFENFKGFVGADFIKDEYGKELEQYTFRQNYYWCLGDNRPFSIDSRSWGLVPEDHIIGLSRRTMWSQNSSDHPNSKIRWNRIYRRLK